jgi:hypothetical protein
MASTSETGHAKNVANFNELITRAKALGVIYNPAKPAQMLPALKAQLEEARQALTALAKAAALFFDMVDEREALYEPLPKLVTRALNMFRSSVDNKAETDTAQSLADLIRGVAGNIKPKKDDVKNGEQDEQSDKSISASRQSYDSMHENFEKFIEVLALNTDYKPNEAELAVTGLRDLLAELKAANDSADSIEIAYGDARGLRNTLLYGKGGIIDTALSVKQYIKGVLKPENVHYKPIAKLEFKRRAG